MVFQELFVPLDCRPTHCYFCYACLQTQRVLQFRQLGHGALLELISESIYSKYKTAQESEGPVSKIFVKCSFCISEINLFYDLTS